MGAFTIPTIFSAIDKLTAPVRKMGKTIFRFSKMAQVQISKLDRVVRKITPSFGELGREILSLASLATFLSLLDRAKNKIIAFESGLVGVGKTTGIEGSKLKSLGVQIIETSDRLKTIKSDTLLELSESAGQLGVTGVKDILKFAETIAKLEKASDVKGDEGAKSIVRLLTITGEGVKVVDRFSASLVALGNSSAASEAEIISVASEVARSTAAYGLQGKEILGLSAALKSLDVRPEAGGTAVGYAMRAIEMAVLKGGKTLKVFSKITGKTPEELREAFGASPLNAFKLFVAGLNRIKNEGGSVAKALSAAGLSGQIVSKGIVPLASNYSLLEDKMKLSNKAFDENTALNEEFAASQKTIAAAIESVERAYDNLFIKQAQAGSKLETIQKVLFFISDNMGTIVFLTGSLIALLVTLKTVVLLGTTALGLYNIALGISAALGMTNIYALRGNAVGLAVYRTAMVLATAAQWIFNAALGAGAVAMAILTSPITLIVAAIILFISIVVLAIKKYDEWGAALLVLLGPIGMLINLIMAFRRNWDAIVETFKTDGIVEGLKKVGLVMLDSLLLPLEQFLNLISNIPGLSIAADFAEQLNNFRADLGVETEPPVEAVNPELDRQTAISRTIENNNQNAKLTIEGDTSGASLDDPGGFVDLLLPKTTFSYD